MQNVAPSWERSHEDHATKLAPGSWSVKREWGVCGEAPAAPAQVENLCYREECKLESLRYRALTQTLVCITMEMLKEGEILRPPGPDSE